MRHIIVIGLLGCALTIPGCVASQYSKSISVKKDANGKVLEIVETETVMQPGQGWPIEFKHLKGVQTSGSDGNSPSGY